MPLISTAQELAEAFGYPRSIIAAVPAESLEHFAGVGNPYAAAPIPERCRVVVVGAGAGFDCFVAARLIGSTGRVVGAEDDAELLSIARRAAEHGPGNIDLRHGPPVELPVASGWADVVVANGTVTRTARAAAIREIHRVLRPAGALQMMVVASDIETDGWCEAMAEAGFQSMAVGRPLDTPRGPGRTLRARAG